MLGVRKSDYSHLLDNFFFFNKTKQHTPKRMLCVRKADYSHLLLYYY